jgi:hypothetical protein
MRKPIVFLSSLAVIAAQAWLYDSSHRPASAGSATHGVYGGYLGSSAWFSAMRRTAANQAMLRALGGSRGRAPIPAGYVEVAGRIVFPGGNPFPKQRIPDLRIRCRDLQADRVERAPFVAGNGGFYTVLQRGRSYDFFWMGYFGSLEKFATATVPEAGAAQRTLSIPYRMGSVSGSDPGRAPVRRPSPGTASASTSPSGSAPASPSAPAPGSRITAADADTFDLTEFPKSPGTFEEQCIMEAIRDATTSPLKAQAHDRLAEYYERKGLSTLAGAEQQRAEYWRSGAK